MHYNLNLNLMYLPKNCYAIRRYATHLHSKAEMKNFSRGNVVSMMNPLDDTFYDRKLWIIKMSYKLIKMFQRCSLLGFGNDGGHM